MKAPTDLPIITSKLLNAEQLLEQLFDPNSRPSLRWLRAQTQAKAIPFLRVGHLVFFDLAMVRTALAHRNLVRHRAGIRSSAHSNAVS